MFTAGVIGCLFAALVYGVSWITTCGIYYLITLCFGIPFSWAIATGVWLVSLLLSSIFKSHITVKK